MLSPRFKTLSKWERVDPSITFASGSPTLSANPRFYKYLWHIFSRASGYEEHEFFEHAPLLCTAAMLLETQRLLDAGNTSFVYGFTRPREGTSIPMDINHPRWRDTIFALPWEDDTDPVTIYGHK